MWTYPSKKGVSVDIKAYYEVLSRVFITPKKNRLLNDIRRYQKNVPVSVLRYERLDAYVDGLTPPILRAYACTRDQ